MLTIYHIEGRRSERVAWLAEELGLDYELIFTPMDVGGSWAAIKAAHPLGVAPTLKDGDLWLVESAAILEYVIGRHGQGRFGMTADQPEWPAYLQWLHYAEGTAMGRMMTETLVKPFLTEDWPEKSPPLIIYLGGAERTMAYLEAEIAGRSYFAGETFTAADIMMELPVRFGLQRLGETDFPNLAAWRKRVTERPAYGRMLARALPNGPPPTVRGWVKDGAAA
jgi:glutathione S-transferase